MKIIVAVYDRVTEAYGPLMVVNTRAEAKRSMREAMKDPENAMAKNPSDYELWQLGEYNDQTGQIGAIGVERLERAEDLIGA